MLCWLQQQDGRLRITYSGHVHHNEAACHQWSWCTLQQQVNDDLPLYWWLTQDLMMNSRCCYVLLLHQSWMEQKQYMCVFIVRFYYFYFSTSEYILLQHLQHQMITCIRLQYITYIHNTFTVCFSEFMGFVTNSVVKIIDFLNISIVNIWNCFCPRRVCRIRTGCFSLSSLRQSADVHNVSEHLVGERKTHFKKCDILCLLQSLCSEPLKSSTSNLLLFSFNKNLKNYYCRVSFFPCGIKNGFKYQYF